MNRPFSPQDLITAAVVLAAALLVPQLFHSIQNAGSIFLPMHIPVLVGGFFLSPPAALVVGILAPLLSGAVTGMPAYPFAWLMAVELGIYSLMTSLLSRRPEMNALAGAMVAGRLVRFLLSMGFYPLVVGVPFSATLVAGALLFQSLPGMALQLLIIPPLVRRIRLARKSR